MNTKTKSNRVIMNEYLTINILSYLSVKEQSSMSLINHSFNKITKKFDFYWKQVCQETFCLTKEKIDYSSPKFKVKINDNLEDILYYKNQQQVETNWKNLFIAGVKARNDFSLFSNSNEDEIDNNSHDLIDDINLTKDELIEGLKGKFYMTIFT